MAASSRAQVLRLYRALLRESQRFSGYNYRFAELNMRCFAINEGRSLSHMVVGGPAGDVCHYRLRMYAIRRIRDAFKENKNIKDSEKIEELVKKAKANLEVIHRQVTIGQLYSAQKLVIESPGNT
ncbi:LYR motif-containing protein 4 isoform X1 [Falco naumanni]|uniref:LYR motif-containing protein 4 isoform X1 n=1 Tax=Falco naumanni TaxID=148594 RepID=UPI001ADEB6C7|nr:LYR motif-containing protein 4 isoform X1 [Falco naumanni]